MAHIGHDEIEPQLAGIGIGRVLDETDTVWRRDRSVPRNHDCDLIAETVDVFGLEPVILVRDPDRNLALHELGIGRRSDDPQDIARLVQLAEIVDARLHVLDAPAVGISRAEGHDLADAGRARIEIDDTVLVFGLEQIRPGSRNGFRQLGVHDEGDRKRVDREPLSFRMTKHIRQFVEIHRLERRYHVFVHGVDAGCGKIIRGVRLRPVTRLVQSDNRRGRAEVVVGHLHGGVAFFECRELGGPIRPGRAGIEGHHHAFLVCRLVKRLLAGIQFRRLGDGLGVRDRRSQDQHGRSH